MIRVLAALATLGVIVVTAPAAACHFAGWVVYHMLEDWE